MSETQHSMSLQDFAHLARMSDPPPHAEGTPIIVTPALARALDAVIDAAGTGDLDQIYDALTELRALHDYLVHIAKAPSPDGSDVNHDAVAQNNRAFRLTSGDALDREGE